MPLSPGMRLGPYEILDALGAGGMGEVYRATDTRLDRTVAVKVLPSHLSSNPELRQRFDREARAISSLTHPHICALYDVGHESGTDYLVMEYLEGTTLAEKLTGGPLPLEEVLRYGREMAEALAAAHRSGVVHRDLKPGNVMLTRSGVKLLDFGLARMGVEGPVSDSSLTMKAESGTARTPLTAEGSILGTFQYMAPEQLEGEEADARTDIFALGAVLYEMLAGKRAFAGKSQASLIASIMGSSPAPISEVAPMTPPGLDRVIRTCLKKDPEERWQTAHDVALQLQWIAEGGSAAGVPRPVTHRRKHRERAAWAVAAVLGLGLIAVAAHDALRPSPPEPRTMRFRVATPPALVSAGPPKISPDGNYLAFNGTDSTGTTRIWVQPLDALDAHPLEGTEGTARPFWSPDSKSLAFFTASQLKRVDAAGGAVRVLLDGVNGSDGTWSPGGTILFDASAGDSIRSVPAAGGEARPASRIDRDRMQTGHAWPHFLPDGKHFLFQANYANGGDSLLVGELGDFETRVLGPANSLMDYSDPGYILWVDSSALLARRFDSKALRFEGDSFPVTTQLAVGSVGLANFSVSRNGVLAYRPGETQKQTLVWVDRTGRQLQTIGPPGDYLQPAMNPDETRIVVDGRTGNAVGADLWILDAVRGTTSRFTYGSGSESAGIWSPDGTRIVYRASGPGGATVLSRDALGTTEPVPVVPDSVSGVPTDWSADGRTLLLQRQSPGSGWDVWAWDLEGKEDPVPVAATRFVEAQGRFSPDGRWVAYTSNESGNLEIYVRSYPGVGGKWQISTGGGSEPFWRGDGKELYYLSLDQTLMSVSVDTGSGFRAGRPQALFRAPVSSNYATRNRYQPAADGERFLLLMRARAGLEPVTLVLNWTAEAGRR